jgi:hydroxymethylbilane synthase
MARLVLGSRGSALALAQVRIVQDALLRFHPGLEIEVKIITTSGDRRQEVKAGEGSAAGLKGLFTKEIQDALLDGSVDAAVHSLKDLPGVTPDSLGLAAVLPRADTSDLLISKAHPSLTSLPDGARVGTGSVRRRRQLQWIRPGVDVVEIRGNVPTRLQKALGLDAIVLARAGLDRLGYSISSGTLQCDAGSFHASPLDILPAIGQGAIGIETRQEDGAARELLAAIDHLPTHVCIRAERELLRLLDGDCKLPVAARATLDEAGQIHAEAIVFPDSEAEMPAHAKGSGTDPEAVALNLFNQLKMIPSSNP